MSGRHVNDIDVELLVPAQLSTSPSSSATADCRCGCIAPDLDILFETHLDEITSAMAVWVAISSPRFFSTTMRTAAQRNSRRSDSGS